MDPLTKPEWRAGVNQVLSPMWRVGEGDPSGLTAPIGATYRQTDANSTYGDLTGLLWNKVGTGTTVGTDWLVDFEGRWISYTPTVTAFSGTFTAVSGAGRWTQQGKMVTLAVEITITTNGTAGTVVQYTAPSPHTIARSSTNTPVGIGRENVASGFPVIIKTESSSVLSMRKVDGTYPGGSGYTLVGTITYEVA